MIFSPETISAVFRGLFGEIEFKGKLPIEIPPHFKFGQSAAVVK